MVEVVKTGAKVRLWVHLLRARLGQALEKVFFGEHGPDRLVGWLVRANEADQALITTVFKARLAYGPDGARGDYRPPEREAWRRERRWRLEAAWGLIVVLQDQPALVFIDLILIGLALIALINNIVSTVMGWIL